MHWQKLENLQNCWAKWIPTNAIFLHDLLQHISSNFYIWVNSSYLVNFGERVMPMSRSFKRQSTILLFWELLLKVQLSSKLGDTWFIVFTMNGASTHIKESNGATIWNWKIKCHEHVDLMLPFRDLEYFLLSQKQQLIQFCELYLTRLETKLALYH
jgi:hypothetical protein